MDRFNQDSNKPENDKSLSDALSTLSLIESVFGADDTLPAEITFELPLLDVLALFPPNYVKSIPSEVTREEMVSVTMDDLFAQLSKGKVALSAMKLAFFVPSHLLEKAAFADSTTMIQLPLPVIVKAVGPAVLQKHMALKTKRYKIDNIQDPFAKKAASSTGTAPAAAAPTAPQPPPPPPMAKEPVSVPKPVVAAPQPVPEPAPVVAPKPPAPPPVPVAEPEPVRIAAEKPPAPSKPRPVRTLPAVAAVPELDFQDLPGNVNVNKASVEELMTLDGMTKALAEKVVEYRSKNGPFKSIFDLASVPRFGGRTFKHITGMPYSKTGHHRRYKLAQWLNMPVDKLTDLPKLAKAIAEHHGFSGCVIADKDGLLLAQSKAEDYGENWSAVSAKIMVQLQESLQLVNEGKMDSVSLMLQGKVATIVTEQNMVLTVISDEGKLAKSLLSLIRKIGLEVAWLLSRRAYVGR